MRFLILSDIHANWEALESVLTDARGRFDRIVCLGDLVGYGADPDLVTEWVWQNAELVIRGNHDKACAGLEDLEWFNPVAQFSALWTQKITKPKNIVYLRKLPKGPAEVEGFQVVHGSPLDEDEYLLSDQDARQIAPYLDLAITFFGHTHVQGGFLCLPNGVKRLAKPKRASNAETIELDPDAYYLINPGSVGQPRDSDPRAAYALYDRERKLVEFRRVEYPVAVAQQKILDAGLPDVLAHRLSAGN